MPPAQRGQGRSKKGFSLLELTVAAAIVCLLFTMVIASYKTRVDKAMLEATVNEMMAIAQASLDFYNSEGTWPITPGDLSPTYLYTPVSSSPFDNSYQISGVNSKVTVSTSVPTGLVQNYYQGSLLQISPGVPQDTISITQCLPNEFTGRLEYEKKYLYRQ